MLYSNLQYDEAYDGNWVKNKKHGNGVLKLKNGNFYEG